VAFAAVLAWADSQTSQLKKDIPARK